MSRKGTRSRSSSWLIVLTCFGLCGLAGTPAFASGDDEPGKVATQPCETSSVAKPKKRKGFGLGGLLGAAQQAGVGRLLGGGMGGAGGKGQIASAVLGTAIEAAGKSASAEASEAANPAAQAAASCPASPAAEPASGK